MSGVSVQTLSPERVVSGVLRQLNQGQIEDAAACFATDFRYKDYGIGLEFVDKERLTEILPEGARALSRLLRAGRPDVRERRACDHAVDASSHPQRAFLCWPCQKDSYRNSRSLGCTY